MVSDFIAAAAVIITVANVSLGLYALRTVLVFKNDIAKQQDAETHEQKTKKMWDDSDKQNLFTRNYLKERTVSGIKATAYYTCLTAIITRPFRMISIVFNFKLLSFAGAEEMFFILGSAASAYGGGLFFTRAWRRFVRHKYYVELKNASWTALLDPMGSANTTTPRAAGAPSTRFTDGGSVMDPTQTQVKKQMTDLGGKTKAARFELPYTFWIKYKGVLTSEKSVIIMSAAFAVFALFVAVATAHNFRLVRFLMALLMSIYVLGTLLILYQVPECETWLNLELATHAICFFAALLNVVICTAVFKNWPKLGVVIIQSAGVLGNATIFLATFYVVPRMVANKVEETEGSLSPMSARARAKIFANDMLDALNDAEIFSQFMAHCCDEFCSENLLALLEMRAYKSLLRKEMIKEKRRVDEEKLKLERKSPRTSPRGATRMWTRPRKNTGTSQTKSGSEPPPIEEKKSDEPILETASGSGMHLTLEIVDSDEASEKSTSDKNQTGGKLGARLRGLTEPNVHTVEKLEHHQSVFAQAVEGRDADNIDIGLVGVQLSEWDIHWTLKLKALGVRSAIVSHKDLDWFQKAQALFAKYVAVDSPLQLNVSYKARNKLELLVGPNSVVGDRLTRIHLLFLFDGVIAAVIANVFDTYNRFKRKN